MSISTQKASCLVLILAEMLRDSSIAMSSIPKLEKFSYPSLDINTIRKTLDKKWEIAIQQTKLTSFFRPLWRKLIGAAVTWPN